VVMSCRSVPHRDLHSFPTRRSSDLKGWAIATLPAAHALKDRTRSSSTISGCRRGGSSLPAVRGRSSPTRGGRWEIACSPAIRSRSEEHTSELQSRENLVCRLLLEKK